jgi:gentisate 1,2-dioxygenase
MRGVPTAAAAALLQAQGLDDLYPVLHANRFTAGWHKARPSLWPEPRTAYRPLHWRYAEGRLALDQAGRWMSTEQAERRNLLLFNPVEHNDYNTARTLVAAYQMIRPGEHARAHWHTPNALRFVLEAGEGAFTVVDGVKLPMHSGDVLLTPGGSWHSHYNEGPDNAYWIDVLDVPLVHLLEPMFCEHYPGGIQPEMSAPDHHEFAYDHRWIESELARQPAADGARRLRLPTDAHLQTMALQFARLDAGGSVEPVRSTASRIFSVAGGSGSARAGDMSFDWSFGDIFVVPSWTPFQISADEPSLLFEVNDEPLLRKINMYREAPTR